MVHFLYIFCTFLIGILFTFCLIISSFSVFSSLNLEYQKYYEIRHDVKLKKSKKLAELNGVIGGKYPTAPSLTGSFKKLRKKSKVQKVKF